MAVVLRFHVGGKFRNSPFRYENPTVVQWKCQREVLCYELIVWILGRMKVNNVGKVFFYKQWDSGIEDMDLDLTIIQCEISFEMFMQSVVDNDFVDLYVEHDESEPLFTEGKPKILPCDLLPLPNTIHSDYFSLNTAELVGESNYNIDEGVRSLGFPRNINEEAAPLAPSFNISSFISVDSSNQEAEGDNNLGSGDRVDEEDGGDSEDDSEDSRESADEVYVGIEGGLGTWVDVPYLTDNEEYTELKKAAKPKKKKNERGETSGSREGQGQGQGQEDRGNRVEEDGGNRVVEDDPRTPALAQDHVDDEIGEDSNASAVSSSSGSDADHGRRRRKTSQCYKPTTNYREIPNFEPGMVFLTAQQFKDAVIEHSLKLHKEVYFVKNDKMRIRIKCLDNSCKWYVYCYKPKYSAHWQLKTLISEHTCPTVFTNSRINYKLIASHFIKERKSTATAMKQKDIKKYTKEELGIEITESQARRARIHIHQHFCGDYEKEFRRIWDYAHELKDSNPGSTVVLEAPGNVFLRMYVCFDAVKRGFLAGCRQVLGVDGCFLKGPYRQQLLSVVGRDGNDQMFPVAWAVVDVENNFNWLWFIETVMKDLRIAKEGLGWTFQSDQHPSIINGVRFLMPKAEHRRCARHLFSKWRKGREGELYSSLFWSVVKSTNLPQLEENLERMYNFDTEAVDVMLKVPPKYWCKNFFKCLSKSDVVDNNMCDTFNAFILNARHLSIVIMFEEIRMLVVQRFVKMRIYGNCTFVGDFGPRILGKIEDFKAASVYCHVFTNGDGGWEVFEGTAKFIVKFEERKCSCRSWDLTGIPCQHAIAIISHMRCKVEDFVAHWYRKDMFLKAYEHSIKPVNDERFRRKTSQPDIIAPPKKAVKGRRRVCRIPEVWEPKSRKKSATKSSNWQRCTLCFKSGHKSTTCSQRSGRNVEAGVSGEGSQSARRVANNLSTQNSTTSVEPSQRRRNHHQNIQPLSRPFGGIESFIDPLTGTTMARQLPTIPSAPVLQSQSSIPTRWFGTYLPPQSTTSSVPILEQRPIDVPEPEQEPSATQLHDQVTSTPALTQLEKRPRGRPKGSKNKKHKPLQ